MDGSGAGYREDCVLVHRLNTALYAVVQTVVVGVGVIGVRRCVAVHGIIRALYFIDVANTIAIGVLTYRLTRPLGLHRAGVPSISGVNRYADIPGEIVGGV